MTIKDKILNRRPVEYEDDYDLGVEEYAPNEKEVQMTALLKTIASEVKELAKEVDTRLDASEKRLAILRKEVDGDELPCEKVTEEVVAPAKKPEPLVSIVTRRDDNDAILTKVSGLLGSQNARSCLDLGLHGRLDTNALYTADLATLCASLRANPSPRETVVSLSIELSRRVSEIIGAVNELKNYDKPDD